MYLYPNVGDVVSLAWTPFLEVRRSIGDVVGLQMHRRRKIVR